MLKSHTISSSHGVPPAQLQPSGGLGGNGAESGDVFPHQIRKEQGGGGWGGVCWKKRKKKILKKKKKGGSVKSWRKFNFKF